MSDVNVILEDIPATEDPHATLTFEKNGIEAKLKITLGFEGDWSNLFDDVDDTEEDARHGFAGEFFARVSQLF